MIMLDGVELDSLARAIARGVDHCTEGQWEIASMDYRGEFTEGALAALGWMNGLNR
jgi:hypothetical protein